MQKGSISFKNCTISEYKYIKIKDEYCKSEYLQFPPPLTSPNLLVWLGAEPAETALMYFQNFATLKKPKTRDSQE